ncbi:MAG: DUF547 domain-containing protein [Alphaproteobacteria bacterium]|nr:DUF547 domain-containing protein [Alphaproteobacteria bacterium]
MNCKRLSIALLVLPLMGFMFLESALAPKADLWPRWMTFNAASQETIDHTPWDRFLKTHIKKNKDGVNRIAYGRISETAKENLSAYLDTMGKTSISRFGRSEQRAFWINLYNALTVRVIAESYPQTSIRDLESPWDTSVIEVEGQPLTLNDIEHRILRPIWRDPRIHYAVNCASIGCPNLLPVAFTGRNTGQLLELAAHGYINHPRGARVEDGNLIVSKIYGWFTEDFGGDDQSVIAHLRQYGEPAPMGALEGRDTIDDYEYDWGLNDAGS